jgi:hypothetical protein
MATLNIPKTAGWNAGKNLIAKPFRIDDIVIDAKISSVFKVSDKMRSEIMKKINAEGYDKSQPIVLWETEDGKYILVDGHTRLAAAKALGLTEIPAVIMDFATFDEAILYTFERQMVRRNLTQGEIVTAVELMPKMASRAKIYLAMLQNLLLMRGWCIFLTVRTRRSLMKSSVCLMRLWIVYR